MIFSYGDVKGTQVQYTADGSAAAAASGCWFYLPVAATGGWLLLSIGGWCPGPRALLLAAGC